MKTTSKFNTLLAFLVLLYPLSIGLAEEHPPKEVTGQIVKIDYQKHKMVTRAFGGDKELLWEEIEATIDFSYQEEGCIDWGAPQSRSLANFFSLQEGDIVQATIVSEKNVNKATLLADTTDSFMDQLTGSKKLFPETLINEFTNPGSWVDVIVTLQKLLESNDDPAESIVEQLSEKDFVLENKTKHTFILQGKISLSGLVKLVESPNVSAIEKNLPVKLH